MAVSNLPSNKATDLRLALLLGVALLAGCGPSPTRTEYGFLSYEGDHLDPVLFMVACPYGVKAPTRQEVMRGVCADGQQPLSASKYMALAWCSDECNGVTEYSAALRTPDGGAACFSSLKLHAPGHSDESMPENVRIPLPRNPP